VAEFWPIGSMTQDRYGDDKQHGLQPEGKVRFHETLCEYEWYFDEIDREQSKQRLEDLITEDGAFLVRRHSSEKSSDVPYTLCVVHGRRVHHVHISRSSGQLYSIGSKKPTNTMFSSVSELIDFYRHNAIQLTVARGVAETIRLTKCPHK
jgi:hypothetical protein